MARITDASKPCLLVSQLSAHTRVYLVGCQLFTVSIQFGPRSRLWRKDLHRKVVEKNRRLATWTCRHMSTMSDVCLRDGNKKPHAIRCFKRFQAAPSGHPVWPPGSCTGADFNQQVQQWVEFTMLQQEGWKVDYVHPRWVKLATPELAKLVFICFYVAIAVTITNMT